jgi:hypothetical protein
VGEQSWKTRPKGAERPLKVREADANLMPRSTLRQGVENTKSSEP